MDQRSMRIALVSSSYYPHFGGVEEHVRHVAKELQDRGHAVEVWTVDRGDGLREEVVDGCLVRYLPTPLPARSARAIASLTLRAPQALARWAGAYAAFRPEIINIQCFGPNGIYGTALSQLTGTPLVVTSHGETFADEHGVFDTSALLRTGLRHAARVGTFTGCSTVVADDLQARFGASKVQVIPNGVDLPRPNSSIPALPQRVSPPVLMGVGRLVPQKGFDILLEAASQSHHRPEVWIVGEGAQRPNLEALSARLKISARVHFLGQRPQPEVQQLMSEASAVVVPSRAEAFGIVVLEAWASGTPVIATNRGGPASIITDQRDGILVDPEDLHSVVSGIDQILGDGDLANRLAAAASDTVRQYTWETAAAQYAHVFQRLRPTKTPPVLLL